MKNKDLKQFTHAELSNFTYEDLESSANELLEKIRGEDRPLPPSVVDRLQKLADDLEAAEPKRHLPIDLRKVFTVENLRKAIPILLEYAKEAGKVIVAELVRQFFQSLL